MWEQKQKKKTNGDSSNTEDFKNINAPDAAQLLKDIEETKKAYADPTPAAASAAARAAESRKSRCRCW